MDILLVWVGFIIIGVTLQLVELIRDSDLTFSRVFRVIGYVGFIITVCYQAAGNLYFTSDLKYLMVHITMNLLLIAIPTIALITDLLFAVGYLQFEKHR